MSKFKVGDRVIGIKNIYECGIKFPIRNCVGTIKCIYEDGDILIDFDNKVERGWKSKNFNIEEGHGLFVKEYNIDFYTE